MKSFFVACLIVIVIRRAFLILWIILIIILSFYRVEWQSNKFVPGAQLNFYKLEIYVVAILIAYIVEPYQNCHIFLSNFALSFIFKCTYSFFIHKWNLQIKNFGLKKIATSQIKFHNNWGFIVKKVREILFSKNSLDII